MNVMVVCIKESSYWKGEEWGEKIKKLSFRRLLHSFSSEPSEQSGLPSHIHVSGMHSPLALRQVNSSVLHTRFSEITTQQDVRTDSCK
jgi:hypothetical protein